MSKGNEVIDCKYNIDTGYVEVLHADGSILQLNYEEAVSKIETNIITRTHLAKLLDENPLDFIGLALDGGLQSHCDRSSNDLVSQSKRIVSDYMVQGYNRNEAEALTREFYRYDS